MKIALLQYQAGQNKEKNIQKALFLCRQAVKKNARMIVLPESFNFRADKMSLKIANQVAESVPGESTNIFSKLAAEKKVFILLGSMFEKRKKTQKPYNTSVLIDDKGKINALYRKINLFKAHINGNIVDESRYCLKGKTLTCAQVGKIRIGFAICYDLRFAEIFKQYRLKNVHLVLVPSCFTYKTGQAHWEVLLRARAIENMYYVAAPNQTTGFCKKPRLYGTSMVVDPWGKVIARASVKKQEILYADIKPDIIKKTRKTLLDFNKT